MNKQKAVVFISGQSNAHAHAQKLPEEQQIIEPLSNVFSLDRNPNQNYNLEKVVWSGFTTAGKNLGESQDHTASLGYYLAKMWQTAIDGGADLPDLYIVQISIGSQGIINGMWNRDREMGELIPGPLKTVKIALFPFAQHIYKLVMADLGEPIMLGYHWIGCEQEIMRGAYKSPDINERYDHFFDTMLGAIGKPCPVYLYETYLKPMCSKFEIEAEAADGVTAAVHRQAERLGAKLVRAKESPYWDENDPCLGIFAKDKGHYLAPVQEWFAQQFYNEVMKKLQ